MYDLIIIGGGPAGLSAAIYAARYKINFIIISPFWGGFVNEAHLIENWLGNRKISGQELSRRFVKHSKDLGVEMITANVQAIVKKSHDFEVVTSDKTYIAKEIIITTGTERKKLGITGEKKLLGRGVSYCATCDGFFFKDKTVVVVGSGDSACTGAVFLADVAKKVYLIYRSSELKAEPLWIEQVRNNKKIEFMPKANPVEIIGQNKVENIKLDNGKTISTDGVFIEIGSTPSKYITQKLGLETDEKDFIIVDKNQETSVKNVWAAGDITTNSSKFQQIITAAAEGAVAVYNAYIDLKK